MKTLPMEEVMSRCKGDGPRGLIDLRLPVTYAAVAGRLDVVRHCIEKRDVPVNN